LNSLCLMVGSFIGEIDMSVNQNKPFNMLTHLVAIAALLAVGTGCSPSEKGQSNLDSPPNVILIMSDDQGIGDFGINGNPIVQTPFIDEMARNPASMSRFYVNAVCSPTRSSLMTGRWSYRTGVTDTFKGRSIMNSEETTITEVLKEAGYSTGLFGKWHFGDNYPYRPMDQGYQTAVYHRGGGLGQPSEPVGLISVTRILYFLGMAISIPSKAFAVMCIFQKR
jgi:hypothetical protein